MAEILTEQALLIFIQLGLAAAQIHISGSQRAGNGSEEHQNGCKSRFFHGDNVPVSYTHLDVYKRQVWLSAFISLSVMAVR